MPVDSSKPQHPYSFFIPLNRYAAGFGCLSAFAPSRDRQWSTQQLARSGRRFSDLVRSGFGDAARVEHVWAAVAGCAAGFGTPRALGRLRGKKTGERPRDTEKGFE